MTSQLLQSIKIYIYSKLSNKLFRKIVILKVPKNVEHHLNQIINKLLHVHLKPFEITINLRN